MWAVYLVWWMALLPILVLLLKKRRYPAIWWMVAWAWVASWLADAIGCSSNRTCAAALHVRHLGPEWTWGAALLLPPIQAALISFPLMKQRRNWYGFLLILGVLLYLSFMAGADRQPEALVTTVAWVGGGILSWDAPTPAAIRWSLLCSFGLGWLLWVWHMTTVTVWPSWYAFQGANVLAIVVFCGGAWRARE